MFNLTLLVGLLLAGALALPHASTALAQLYPSKPVRIVTGGSPGTTPDILARMIGNKLSEYWGQPVVIENRQPAIIAYSMVAKAMPDGHTLLQAAPSVAVRAVMSTNLPYDTQKDFAGITEIGYSNIVVVVSPALGVRSVKELAAYTEAHPGKSFYATVSVGSVDHMTVERFRAASGVKGKHVSFKGAPEAMIEVVAGRAHFTTAGLTTAMPFIKDGKLIALVQLAPFLPGVPLAADVVPQWKQMGSQAVFAPAGTPIALRRRIGADIARVLNLPDVRERLNSVAFHVATTTPEEHERNLRRDIEAFTKVARDLGLKPQG